MKKILLALMLVSIAVPAMADCYSDGIRVGVVQKFSKKGMLMKSWEGELVMEGTKSTGRSATDVWKFSTLDAASAAVIEDSMMSGKSVSLKYCQLSPYTPNIDTDTTYRIVKAVIRQ